MATPDIIFYTSKGCPYAHRVELAFQEAGADVTRYQIDLQNKPEWYAQRVNPAGKVPALVYGSSKSDPEHPSPESVKLAESLILLEFVADLYPDSGLLPKDPVQRARVRLFIDTVTNKLFEPFVAFFYRGEAPDKFVEAVAETQKLLSPSGFAVGDRFTIADAALAPFVGRWELHLRHDVGKYAEGTGPRVHQELFQSERFARLQKFFANISSRQSYKTSFDSEYLLSSARARIGR
ncbi:thioredoxin-like protein [Russula earlei]|uniref:Thioredoxin-like protein n=1 Tax=Russula earlei TaxID=71964 RepID=A0ACC0TXS6_9AGAM|nr:thioredoxin-like protein [Russula earlei]